MSLKTVVLLWLYIAPGKVNRNSSEPIDLIGGAKCIEEGRISVHVNVYRQHFIEAGHWLT